MYLPGTLALGVLAALTPGPLMAMAGKETLRGGFRAGFRVSLIPSLATLPLPLACAIGYTWAERWAESQELKDSIIAATTLISALLFCWLAYKEFRPQAASKSLQPSGWTLALIGWSNPAMLLFWATVGGQLASIAYREHEWPGVLLVVAGFYIPVAAFEAAMLLGLHLANIGRQRLKFPRLETGLGRRLRAIAQLRWNAYAYFAIATWMVAGNWPSFSRLGSAVCNLAL